MEEEDQTFQQAIEALARKDGRYDPDAYYFLRESLDATYRDLSEKAGSPVFRHVSAAELLDGFRKLALDEFGPLALLVLETWGIARTQDIGRMVFNLISAGVFGKDEDDRLSDFDDVFDFHEAFALPYEVPETPES
ncbi:MAG: Minf_1886 family protein [Kiritimatiellia bacterium]|jgi:uncharacterized repeat protein (TIGR04138 family)